MKTTERDRSRSAARLLFLETADWAFCQHRLALARAARDAGFDVGLVSPPGDKVEAIRSHGFAFHPLRMSRTGTNPFEEALAVSEIASIYRHLRPDIVHHVSLKSALNGTLAARLAGVPAIVNSITGLGYSFTADDFRRKALQMVISNALRIVLRSPRVRNVFQNPDDMGLFIEKRIANRGQCQIIRGSGVDTEKFAPWPEPEGPPVILLASRLLWDKGIGELAEAVAALKREGLSFSVIVAGNPDPYNPASIPQDKLSVWREQGLMELPGHVRDMATLVRHCHIACLPSYREGLPLFLLEAAATGRPAVTTDVPGCREVVRHGENGLLVPPRDARSLTDALRTLLLDRDIRLRMGRRGRSMAVGHFSKEKVIDNMFCLYGSLLGRPIQRRMPVVSFKRPAT